MIAIEPIPAFTDNYIWCLHDDAKAWVVDPGAAAPVIAYLSAHRLQLEGILITHHHADHTGGIAELDERYQLRTIYGPNNPTIDGIREALEQGDKITILGQHFRVLETPGHTLDHIAFFDEESTPPVLFCGDTLFAAGCGRLFEGTAAQMYASLQKLAQLPGDTRVYCTHEYTLSNLKFALAVEPENPALIARVKTATQTRADGEPTLPSTIDLELITNPFLRSEIADVRNAALRRVPEADTPTEIFAAIRQWKDQF